MSIARPPFVLFASGAAILASAWLLPACKNAATTERSKRPPAGASGETVDKKTSADEDESCFEIVDGETTGAYPSTYLVAALNATTGVPITSCTGTFIGDNVMITAAHCMPTGKPGDFVVLANGRQINKDNATLKGAVHALKFFVPDTVRPGTEGTMSNDNLPFSDDIAIVLFPDKTAKAVSPLATKSSPPGTTVTLVGYGAGDTTRQEAALPYTLKKFGTNVLKPVNKNFPWEGVYQTHAWAHAGEAAQHGEATSSAAPGDSGGPLFRGTTLIGTVKFGFTDEIVPNIQTMIGKNAVNFWVDVTNPSVKKVLAKAEAAGARITYDTGAPPAAVAAVPEDDSTADNEATTSTAALPDTVPKCGAALAPKPARKL